MGWGFFSAQVSPQTTCSKKWPIPVRSSSGCVNSVGLLVTMASFDALFFEGFQAFERAGVQNGLVAIEAGGNGGE